jgi:hypothetical protein
MMFDLFYQLKYFSQRRERAMKKACHGFELRHTCNLPVVKLKLNKEQTVQECDARMLNRITEAGNKKK